MFRDTIRGLEKVFKTDISPPKIVLVTGPPGSMKTTFIHAILSKYLRNRDEFGLYATLEEDVQSHLANMRGMGIELPPNLQISDYTEIRERDEEVDYLLFTERMLARFKQLKGDKFTCFGFDSLGALYSLTEKKNLRKKMFHFFRTLRDYNLFAFIAMERSPGGESELLGNEGFLADGIILLGLERLQGRLVRYLQIEKMRACNHSMEMHALEVTSNDGLAVLGPIFTR